MAMPERSDTEDRDYARPATWGDVEHVRLTLEKQVGDVQVQVAKLEAETKARFAEVEAQMKVDRAEAKAENARLEAQIAETRAEIAEARAEARAENAKTRESVTRLIVIGGGIAVAILGGLQGLLQAFA